MSGTPTHFSRLKFFPARAIHHSLTTIHIFTVSLIHFFTIAVNRVQSEPVQSHRKAANLISD
jgi:hypothetical protein